MKNIVLIALLLTGGLSSHAQELSRSVTLNDTTLTNTVTFEVAEKVSRIECKLNGFLSSGDFSMFVEDPEGRKYLGFELGAETKKDGTVHPAKGQTTRSIKTPLKGTWRIKIKTTGATGNYTYVIHLR